MPTPSPSSSSAEAEARWALRWQQHESLGILELTLKATLGVNTLPVNSLLVALSVSSRCLPFRTARPRPNTNR